MRALPRAAAAALLLAALAGCAPAVTMEAADAASDPVCAEVIVRLPETLGDLQLRETDAQGTGAWGEPASVLLRCGVEVPPPSELPCVLVGDVYWLREELEEDVFEFTTYGREPAVEVIADRSAVTPGVVLLDLGDAVARTEATAQCLSVEDSLEG